MNILKTMMTATLLSSILAGTAQAEQVWSNTYEEYIDVSGIYDGESKQGRGVKLQIENDILGKQVWSVEYEEYVDADMSNDKMANAAAHVFNYDETIREQSI